MNFNILHSLKNGSTLDLSNKGLTDIPQGVLRYVATYQVYNLIISNNPLRQLKGLKK